MKAIVLAFCCLMLAALPAQAQDRCTLPPRLQSGEGGRIPFRDGAPHPVWAYPGIAPLVAIYFEGYSFTLTERDPVCQNGVRWWEIEGQTRDVLWKGWLAEGADGVYFTEPLPREQSQENVRLRTSLFYGRLWAIVERDQRGIFTPSGVMWGPGFITAAQQAKIFRYRNFLYYWDETGLYQTGIVDGETRLLQGDQSRIVDIAYSDYQGLAVLYAEDCDRCYTFYIAYFDQDTNPYEQTLVWRGKTDDPLVGIAGWIQRDSVVWVLEQDTERPDSPYASSGIQLMEVSPTHGLSPLKAMPGADQVIADYPTAWLAAAGDKLQLFNLESDEAYSVPLQYGQVAALPMFSDYGEVVVWFEINSDGEKPQTITLRSHSLLTRQTTSLFTFDVRDGRLPLPQVMLSSGEFTLIYRDSLMIFSMGQAVSTTWFPAPAPDILGVVWIGG